MRETRENATRLPNITLPGEITVTADIAEALRADTLLLAVPMQKLRSALQDHAPALRGKTLVACCKGIELTSGLGPVAVIKESIPDALRRAADRAQFCR